MQGGSVSFREQGSVTRKQIARMRHDVRRRSRKLFPSTLGMEATRHVTSPQDYLVLFRGSRQPLAA
jgi:hypothetical protein